MNTTYERLPAVELRQVLTSLRGHWLWLVLVGLVLIILGTLALGAAWIAALAAAVVIGTLLVVSGLVETVGTFWSRGWSGYFVHFLSGVLSIVVGLLFLQAPAAAVLDLTLPVACLLLLVGVFKIIAALTYRFAAWGWPLASGVIDLALGVLLLLEWPENALWVIGMYVGISLLFRGLSWIGLGVALGMLPLVVADGTGHGPVGHPQTGVRHG